MPGWRRSRSGELRIGGERVNEKAPKDRDIAMVFQSYALYPHMTVRQNIAFPLTLAKLKKAEIATKVEETAKILDLTELLDRKPAQLSGGQRQRVAMGRAIVRNPKAFLMDEPLSNLDAKLRVQMRSEIARLQNRLGTTTVYVTHDQTEAMTLGDRVVVLRAGEAQQIGTPEELYYQAREPVRRRVHRIACDELLPGDDDRCRGPAAVRRGHADPGGARPARAAQRTGQRDRGYPARTSRGRLADRHLRADPCVDLRGDGRTSSSRSAQTSTSTSPPRVPALRLSQLAELAAESGVGENEFVARVSTESKVTPGQTIELALDTTKLVIFDADTGANLSIPPAGAREEQAAPPLPASSPTPPSPDEEQTAPPRSDRCPRGGRRPPARTLRHGSPTPRA